MTIFICELHRNRPIPMRTVDPCGIFVSNNRLIQLCCILLRNCEIIKEGKYGAHFFFLFFFVCKKLFNYFVIMQAFKLLLTLCYKICNCSLYLKFIKMIMYNFHCTETNQWADFYRIYQTYKIMKRIQLLLLIFKLSSTKVT